MASTSDAPTCTVTRGLVQIDADAFAWVTISNPTVKYGVNDSAGIRRNRVPFTRVQTRDALGNLSTRSGIGDMTLRPRQRPARPNPQFDVGADVGHNRNTPDQVSHVGVSTRF
jgi:hypothetical protein